jgi:hypothetical protein
VRAGNKRWYAKNGERKRADVREAVTGQSAAYFRAALVEQGFRCGVCDKGLDPNAKSTHADHDHISGEPRGVLCHVCNIALGWVDDDDRLAALLRYRDNWRRRHDAWDR